MENYSHHRQDPGAASSLPLLGAPPSAGLFSYLSVHDRRYCVISATSPIRFLCFDLVKKLLLGSMAIGDVEIEKIAEALPNMINLTETRPDVHIVVRQCAPTLAP